MNILFSSAVLLSAFLLFWVELFFAKLLLPQFGGGAHIWTTCLAAFQVLLLIGYGYAWGIAKLPLPRQAAAQVLLLSAAVATLPISLKTWQITAIPSLQICFTIAVSVGLPMIALSTTSSVLQTWYGHASKRNPYFLYALSNVGSLLALIAYPGWFEPNLLVRQQSTLWSGLFAVSAILTATAIFTAYAPARAFSRKAASTESVTPELSRFTPWMQLQCFVCAFIPASLLSGVTSYVTTEIAPNPIVWAIFLGLYLITLILTFLPTPCLMPRGVGNPLLLFILVFLGVDVYGLAKFDRDALLGNIVFFLLLAWFYHSRLATLKPTLRQLSRFYFIMVLGGACGAIFNAIVAPLIFIRLSEYHVILALAAPLLLSLQTFDQQRWLPQTIQRYTRPIVVGLCLCFTVVYAFPVLAQTGEYQVEHQARSFYSSYVVGKNADSRFLIHGHTLHGRESLNEHDRTPGTYYHPGGPVANVFELLPSNAAVAVVGLGVGEIATYAKPDQNWTFFELDPLVVTIAQNNFHHLRQMPTPPKMIVGDGRLQFQAHPAVYDLIVLDAFNSDAIPLHLLTHEALRDVFLPQLKPDGILLYNITNTFVELEPIVQQLAQATHRTALTRFSPAGASSFEQSANQWVALVENSQSLEALKRQGWHQLQPGKTLWTDSFSSIRAAMKRRDA
jgi:spermidine synthase